MLGRGAMEHVWPWGTWGPQGLEKMNYRTPLWVTNSKKRGKHPELVDSCSKARSQDENYDSEKQTEPPGMF